MTPPGAGARAVALITLAFQLLDDPVLRIPLRCDCDPDGIRCVHRPLLQECRYEEPRLIESDLVPNGFEIITFRDAQVEVSTY